MSSIANVQKWGQSRKKQDLTPMAIVCVLTLAQPAQVLPPTGLIVGQVVDAATGKPVSHAIVMISGLPNVRAATEPGRISVNPPGPAGPAAILTGSDGRFVFRDLPGGSFGIDAAKSGYSNGSYGRRRTGGPSQQLTLAAGERRGDVVIPIWKQAVISGKVVDEAGEPLVGIQVRAFRRRGLPDPRRLAMAKSAVTDDRGMYRLAMLDPAAYIVCVVQRNSTVSLATAQRSPEGVTIVGGINRPGTSAAMQVGDDVFMLGSGSPIPPPASRSRLPAYPPVFYPSVQNLAEAVEVKLAPGEERDGIDLQLTPVTTVRVSGMIVGAGENAGLPVRLLPANHAEIELDTDAPASVADRSGAFAFAAVPAGEYVLRATTRGVDAQRSGELQFAEMPVTVGGADIDGIALALRPGIRISGRFEFEGARARPTALGSVTIAVESAGGSIVAPSSGFNPVRANNSGTFSSAALGAGRYYVRVVGSPSGWMFKSATLHGRDVADTAMELRDGDVTDVVITFSDRWSGLNGTVLTAAGAPDHTALVIAFPTDPQTWSSAGLNPRRLRSVRPAKTGQYTFATLSPGDYYVTAIPDEQSADWRDARFLESAARIARRVTIADGERPTQDLRTREVR